MKLRTSYSKLTTFKKDITRFAPIWALYLIGMMLVLFEAGGYRTYDRFAESNMAELIQSFGIVNLIYAAVIAVMLFGDLYNTRMCYSLHTQPARREVLLLSHAAAGFLFSLVPNVIASLYLMTQLESYWFLALYWLLAVQLQFIFYYGVAMVSALLVGNRFAMLLVYAGINFVSMLAYWIVNTIYLPQMPGVILDMVPFTRFCPTVDLMESWEFFEFKGISVPDPAWPGEMTTFYEYVGLADGWGYLAILAVIGLAMMGLAVLLYRMRHLESAGDFVAFPRLKNVACVVMTVCVAGVFAFAAEELFGESMIIWMIVGLIVGFFGSLMLLERRIKVFRGKTFLGLGALAAVLFISFLLVVFDVFGVVRWTPATGDVESVTITNYRPSGGNLIYDMDYYYGNRMSVKLTEEADIAQIITAHEDVLAHLEDDYNGSSLTTDDFHRITFIYELDNGRTVIRTYNALAKGTNYEIVSKYFYTPQNILGYTDWETYVSNVEFMYAEGLEIPKEMYRQMLEALKTDCENGQVTLHGNKKAAFSLEMQTKAGDDRYVYRTLFVLPGAENTLALMKSPEMLLGFTDAAAAARTMQYAAVSGFEIDKEYWVSLLEALLQDCEEGNISLGYHDGMPYEVHLEFMNENGTWNYRFLYVSEKARNTYNWILEQKEHWG